MQDQNQTNPTPTKNFPLPSDDVIVNPDVPDSPAPTATPTDTTTPAEPDELLKMPDDTSSTSVMKEVTEKIKNVHNILIALSSDPSVDEIATAIALSLCLDRAGKRVTAIYSGTTPNALQFLRPERTFETDSSVLKDFVIALNKDKADHLRYKLDGDYVKIFITPYKSSINESDLEFSLGDFNIELVLALNVPSGVDLDAALREHGRVMHDATVVNVTNGNPGKFGDIEWSDKTKSSIAEMVADLLYSVGGDNAIEAEDATALLTGIVAATDHFTNNMTTANSLQIAAELIRSGADRKLITENIGLDSENKFFFGAPQEKDDGEGSIEINHDADEPISEPAPESTSKEPTLEEPAPESASEPITGFSSTVAEPAAADTIQTSLQTSASEPATESEEANLLADLQAAADSLKNAAEITNPAPNEPSSSEPKPEITLTPSENFMAEPSGNSNNYGQMLEEALADSPSTSVSNPIASAIPSVPTAPDINGVPVINYASTPSEDILPPPPAPPIDPSAAMPSDMSSTSPEPQMPPLTPTLTPSLNS